MKVSLILFALLFSFSLVAKEISDFQIEGISIGDSLTDHFSEKEISNPQHIHDYKNIPFKYYLFRSNQSSVYDFIQVTVKSNNKYISSSKSMIVHAVDGLIISFNDIQECYSKMSMITKELEDFFNISGVEDSGIRKNDPSGKSTYKRFLLYINNNQYSDASVVCSDMSDAMSKLGKYDNLKVGIHSQEFIEQISLYEYK